MIKKIGTVATRRLSFCFCLAIMVGIFIFSAQTADVSDQTSGGVVEVVMNALNIEHTKENVGILTVIIRKLGHFSEFLLLGSAVSLYFWHFEIKNFKKISFAFLCSTGYAITDEIHQIFVPGRACRILDVFIDACGSLVGIFAFCLVLWLVLRIMSKKVS